MIEFELELELLAITMDVDSEQKQTQKDHIEELEAVETNVQHLLQNTYETMTLLKTLDPSKQDELKSRVNEYHLLLQSIQTDLSKQINQCREPLLLPLLPIGHKNQFIARDARDVHKKLFSPKKPAPKINTMNSQKSVKSEAK